MSKKLKSTQQIWDETAFKTSIYGTIVSCAFRLFFSHGDGQFCQSKRKVRQLQKYVLCRFVPDSHLVRIFLQRGSELKCVATTKGVKGKSPKAPRWNEIFLLTYVARGLFLASQIHRDAVPADYLSIELSNNGSVLGEVSLCQLQTIQPQDEVCC
jgi:hypothetical protein